MSPQPQERMGHNLAGRHILLIEQDVTRRQVLYDALTQHGFSVYAVRSGDMALTVLGYERPDLILLNPELTDMSGVQIVEKIRSFNPTVPILLLCNGETTATNGMAPHAVQARLPLDVPEEKLLAEVTRWLAVPVPVPPERQAGIILLIDDELRMRTIMENVLELNGFTVMTAKSGEEGLAKLSKLVPHAVMLDIRMPGIDGLLTLKKIRSLHPHLPVILVTHVDEDAAREEAMRLGANGYLTKPLNFDDLKRILHEVILDHRPRK